MFNLKNCLGGLVQGCCAGVLCGCCAGAWGDPPAHFQIHENDDSPCISCDPEAHRPPPALFQNPWKWSRSYAFLMMLKPIAPLPSTSKDLKMMMVICVSHDSEANHPLPPSSKTMKMMTILCISYDSEATRPLPHFQTMKMMTALCISYDSEANRIPPTHFQTMKMVTVLCISYDSGPSR